MLGDQLRALDDLREVALGEALALRHHAEPVGARGLGRARVLEHLLGLHHRVHRGLGVRVLRLRAEAAVLGAAAALRVHERAHVGGLAEVVLAHHPRDVDEPLDVGVGLELAELERLFEGDQGRHSGAM